MCKVGSRSITPSRSRKRRKKGVDEVVIDLPNMGLRPPVRFFHEGKELEQVAQVVAQGVRGDVFLHPQKRGVAVDEVVQLKYRHRLEKTTIPISPRRRKRLKWTRMRVWCNQHSGYRHEVLPSLPAPDC